MPTNAPSSGASRNASACVSRSGRNAAARRSSSGVRVATISCASATCSSTANDLRRLDAPARRRDGGSPLLRYPRPARVAASRHHTGGRRRGALPRLRRCERGDLEAAALPAMTRDERRAKAHGIYAIVDEGTGDPLAIADGALAGGVRILQYRAKSGIVPARLYALRERTRAYGALLIVNDDPHAAVAYDCDGVHLGPGDDGFDDPDRVRAALGERLIGLSCGTEDEARW